MPHLQIATASTHCDSISEDESIAVHAIFETSKCLQRVETFYIQPAAVNYYQFYYTIQKFFRLKNNVSLFYKTREGLQQTLQSDFDLDAALLSSDGELAVIVRDRDIENDALDEWDCVSLEDVPSDEERWPPDVKKRSLLDNFTESLSTTVTNIITRASTTQLARDLSRSPLRSVGSFQDSQGRFLRWEEFRYAVFNNGLDPRIRHSMWPVLVGVYQKNFTTNDRVAFMQRKCAEYSRLKAEWESELLENVTATKKMVSMVKKDVVRTDRRHAYYSGKDSDKNTLALFNLLVTYAFTHPEVSYCQGMSDLASPILLVMNNETEAYVCFCALMLRLKHNFVQDETGLITKFQHLRQLLRQHDSQYYDYLVSVDADKLLFAYRWILLELKREFPLDEVCYVLEVMWSTIPHDTTGELQLFDADYRDASRIAPPRPVSPYSRVCDAIKRGCSRRHCRLRQSSHSFSERPIMSSDDEIEKEQAASYACGGDKHRRRTRRRVCSCCVVTPRSNLMLQRFVNVKNPDEMTPCRARSQSFDIARGRVQSLSEDIPSSFNSGSTLLDQARAVKPANLSPVKQNSPNTSKSLTDSGSELDDSVDHTSGLASSPRRLGSFVLGAPTLETQLSSDVYSDVERASADSPYLASNESGSALEDSPQRSPQVQKSPPASESTSALNTPAKSTLKRNELFDSCELLDEAVDQQSVKTCRHRGPDSGFTGSTFGSEIASSDDGATFDLPPPSELGFGNPFLMYLCLALLQQQRGVILKRQMDCNDIAMHFDSLMRRHDVGKAVGQARRMFERYQARWSASETCKVCA